MYICSNKTYNGCKKGTLMPPWLVSWPQTYCKFKYVPFSIISRSTLSGARWKISRRACEMRSLRTGRGPGPIVQKLDYLLQPQLPWPVWHDQNSWVTTLSSFSSWYDQTQKRKCITQYVWPQVNQNNHTLRSTISPREKNRVQWVFSCEVNRSAAIRPNLFHNWFTTWGWSVYSPYRGFPLDRSSAPTFIIPGTWVARNEWKCFKPHTMSRRARLWSWGECVPLGDLYIPPPLCCPIWPKCGDSVGTAWNVSMLDTVNSSRKFICAFCSEMGHFPFAILPSHAAPQPVIDTSVVTTFLREIVSSGVPDSRKTWSLQQQRACKQCDNAITLR